MSRFYCFCREGEREGIGRGWRVVHDAKDKRATYARQSERSTRAKGKVTPFRPERSTTPEVKRCSRCAFSVSQSYPTAMCPAAWQALCSEYQIPVSDGTNTRLRIVHSYLAQKLTRCANISMSQPRPLLADASARKRLSVSSIGRDTPARSRARKKSCRLSDPIADTST